MGFLIGLAIVGGLFYWWLRAARKALPGALKSAEGITHNVMGALSGVRPSSDLTALPSQTLEPIDTSRFIPGTRWSNSAGQTYDIVGVANEGLSDPLRYPVSVIYRGPSGNLLLRRADHWDLHPAPVIEKSAN